MAMTTPVRLQKYLAQCGLASRRKSEQLIAEGLISVDGKVVTEMGVTVTPGVNSVTFRGNQLKVKEDFVYYLLNKPQGYVTTLSDPQGRPIVSSLIKEGGVRLFPIGRLDLDTEGALIMTNDGQLAQRIQHPSNETNKTYEALIKGRPSREKIALLENGIPIEGKMTSPATIQMLAVKDHNCLLKITIHEGRKRQVKKMFSNIGHPVLHLKRVAYGKLTLGNLPIGSYRQLSSLDLRKIFL
jgi:23S rRNA pseudouridine2605 synthase